jgi:thiamine biosynthesis lipoprotein
LTESTSFSALGSTAVVATSEAERLPAAVTAVERVVAAFDHACSRFRADSELSKINRVAGQPIRVSPLMIEATLAGVRAAELTDGDVDPTLGAVLVALGYDRDFELGLGDRGAGVEPGAVGVRPREPTISASRVAGWRTIRVEPQAGTVAIGRGLSLDLGATAKALAADHAARAAREAAACGVLVGLGGDLATDGPAPAEGWRVRVTDDHRADTDAPGQWITIEAGGIATSSTVVRRWRRADGGEAHHLLDPATGQPAGGGWRTVTVAAANCVDANIASTAAIVRGPRAVAWLEALGMPSRLVSDDGRVVHVAGWPVEGDDLPPAVAEKVRAQA